MPRELLHHSESVHERGLPAAAVVTWHRLQHEQKRRLIGQRRDEELLLELEDRTRSRKRYATRDEARADVFDYIECFYNPRRRHSVLDYLSPVQFEDKMETM